MARWSWLAAALLALAAPLRAGEGPRGAPDELGTWIRQLGAPSWADRNAAALRLEEAGPAAFEALFRASREDADPEVRHRAKLLLASGLWKGLPAHLEESFRGFFHLPAENRAAQLRRLLDRDSGLTPEVLHLYLSRVFLFDPDDAVRAAALEIMDTAGVLLADGALESLGRLRGDPWSRRALALAASRCGFHDAAIEPLLALEPAADPEDLELALALARSLHAAGRGAEAASRAHRALTLAGQRPAFDILEPARILVRNGRGRDLPALLPDSGVRPELRVLLAAELAAAGLPGDGATLLRADEPGAEGVLRARLLARAGQRDAALASFSVALAANGPDGPGILVQARALARHGLGPELLDLLDRSDDGEGAPAAVLLERAQLLAALDRPGEAAALLADEEARARLLEDPGRFWRGACELLASLGRAAEGEALARAARLQAMDDPDAARILAGFLMARGAEEDALLVPLASLPFLDEPDGRRRLVDRLLAGAESAGRLEWLDGELSARVAAFEASWKTRARRAPRFVLLSDSTRAVHLSLLARVRQRRGANALEVRTLCNRSWELAEHSLEACVLLDRLDVERALADSGSRAFLRLFLGTAVGDPAATRDDLAAAWASLRFGCLWADARWAEAALGVVWTDPTARLESILRSALPAPRAGPALPLPLNPPLANHLWALSRRPQDYRRTPALDVGALEALVAVEGDAAWDLLVRVADRGEEPLRRAAVGALKRAAAPRAVRPLLGVLRRSVGDFPNQVVLADALAGFPADALQPDLDALLAGRAGRLRPLAAWILHRRGDPKATALLRETAVLAAAPLEAREFAALVLAAGADPGDRDLFRRLSGSFDAPLRAAGWLGLARLGDAQGPAGIARELAWGARTAPADLSRAVQAAGIAGGPALARALADLLVPGAAPHMELMRALAGHGRDGRAQWRRVLDLQPFGESGSGGLLAPVFDALALWGEQDACAEALALIEDDAAAGILAGPALARAALLARAAGDDRATRYFAWSRDRLDPAGSEDEAAALVALLGLFGREEEAAADAARRWRFFTGGGGPQAWLVAGALARGNAKSAARALAAEVLAGFPGPGRPALLQLRADLEGK